MAEYFLTGSFSVSNLDYSNKMASIDSRNHSEMIMLKAGLVNKLGNYVRSKVTIDHENTLVRSENYENGNSRRNVTSVTGLAEVKGDSRIGASFLLRQTLENNSFLIPDFSTGLQFRITDNKDYYFKANYSRNSKLPSMNDLFWAPGGNRSLMNESANMFEFIYEMKQKVSMPLLLKFNMSIYLNTIKNMIQWRPGEYSYWVADNVKSANTSGLESALSFSYNLNKISSGFDLSYSYTRAITTDSDIPNDESVGKQLIYVPQHQANATFRFSYQNLYSYWISSFTGMRYTTLDNSYSLPGYLLNSISAGYTLHHGSNLYNMSLTIDNLFNTTYETIAYYPQPGRSFFLKLLIQFSI
jgi:iron complex outermembrane receptor protein